MYPRCDGPDEAREVVKWAKFAPLGKRGFDGSGPDVPYLLNPLDQYLKEANEQTFVLIQMEEPHAVEQAEAIAAVPGVDMLMLGPADFSVLTGIPFNFSHPTVVAAIEKVARAAKNQGKHWAATCGSIEIAKKYIDMGCGLIFHGCDIVYVKAGLEQVRQAAIEQAGVRFGGAKADGSGKSYLGGR
jgi:4-hydroxy-2-oxoheptanedioate aldolase